ncbi:Arginine/ornithine antiporter ArcD [Photobacterium marinum]|uniref:Arginine/ornithine antiporter ArcD n=1 Tax=Photobacterium marinum TaxID=1056511 RepID=L8JAE0_9GAMM|nr:MULTISPECIES: YfcC family protein [Photobacterium]ELR65825.1 Arginine/ornithine antiporter ArcD [Photobacterium marinum]
MSTEGATVDRPAKKKLSFPSAYTVLFCVAAIVALLTWFVDAGVYNKLSYQGDSFMITYADGSTKDLPATQETLDSVGIKADLEKFVNGDIYKPVGIPNSYTPVEPNPQGILELFKAPIQGMYQSIDVVFFVLVIGGFIGIVNHSGAFGAGINRLSQVMTGREKWLIVIVTALISLGGTSFGMAEETIAFYPILVPIFIAAGYDAIVALAAIYLGSSIGTMCSTVNPFSTIIASNAAGINWTLGLTSRMALLTVGTIVCILYIIRYAQRVKEDPTKSLIYSQKKEIEERFLKNFNKDGGTTKLDKKHSIILTLFASTFFIMVYGVSSLGWWFEEMTTLFFVSSIVIALVDRIPEKEFVREFIQGANDLLGVALIIAIARGVTVLMDGGMISDSILNASASMVDGMDKGLFIVVMMFLFGGVSFFVPSSSGLAVLSMPIMAPLADVVGIPRDNIVSAYQFGMGLMAFITPTGLVLASLAMVNVTFDKWLKFVMPLLGILIALSAATLLINVYI